MPRYADVEGIGRLEFPDDASDQEIDAHVQEMDRQRLRPITPLPVPSGQPLAMAPQAQVAVAPLGPPIPAPSGVQLLDTTRPLTNRFNPGGMLPHPDFPFPVEHPWTEEERQQSLLGITPEMVPSGVGSPAPALTIPLSAMGRLGAGVGQYMTSPQGIVEIAAAHTPIAPLVYAKWAKDMYQGAKQSVAGIGESARGLLGEYLTSQYAKSIPGAVPPDPMAMQEQAQQLAEHTVNAAGMGLGAVGAAGHGLRLVKERIAPAPEIKAARDEAAKAQTVKDAQALAEELSKSLQENQILRGEKAVPTTAGLVANGAATAPVTAPPSTPAPVVEPGVQPAVASLPAAGPDLPAVPKEEPPVPTYDKAQNGPSSDRTVQDQAGQAAVPTAPEGQKAERVKALRYGDIVWGGTTHSIAGMKLLDELRRQGIEYDPAKLERGDIVNGVFEPEVTETPPSKTIGAQSSQSPPVEPSPTKPKEPTEAGREIPSPGGYGVPASSVGGLPPTLEELARKVATTGERLTKHEQDLLDEVRQKEPETHKAYIKKVMALRGVERKPFTAQLPPNAIQLQGPRLMAQPESLGYKTGYEGRVDPGQLFNRLRNMTTTGKLAKAEFEVYEKMGLERFLKDAKPTLGEVGKWMEENAPRVEVRKFGTNQGGVNSARLAEIEHELDSLLSHHDINDLFQYGDVEEVLSRRAITQEQADSIRRLYREYDSLNPSFSDSPSSSANWSSIAPKTEDRMPGYVEGAVVVSTKMKKGAIEREGAYQDESQMKNVMHPSSHHFPPNTLGFFRGYMETTPDGRKVFHVLEVQSDWAQHVRELKEQQKQEGGMTDKWIEHKSHPLLRDWERLTVKAAIDHAIKEGADEVAVQDAESAMMMEGHDRNLRASGEPKQAQGMRLHYDQTIPRILKELTGAEGRAVDFGEHRMAYEAHPENFDINDPDVNVDEEGNIIQTLAQPRPDLIFRNPDGTPKTTITARSYDLSKVRAQQEPFSLMGKDRKSVGNEPRPQAPPSASFARFDDPSTAKLGLEDGATAFDALSRLAADPKEFGHDYAALADFLVRNFEPSLRATLVDAGGGHVGTTHYSMLDEKIYMDMASRDYPTSYKLLHEAAHAATSYRLEYPETASHIAAKKALNELRTQAVNELFTPKEQKFFNDVYKPLIDEGMRNGKGIDFPRLAKEFDKNGISRLQHTTMYGLANEHEFVGGMFSDRVFRNRLANMEVKGQGLVQRFVDAVKSLLGIKRGTVLDRAMDALIEFSDRTEALDRTEARTASNGRPQAPFSNSNAQIKTPAFKQWFGKSKVVDKEGNPLVVYHGTLNKEPFSVFEQGKRPTGKGAETLGEGFYFSPDKEIASGYATKYSGPEDKPIDAGVVYPVYLRIENPARLADMQRIFNHKDFSFPGGLPNGNVMTKRLKSLGYDGIILEREIVVFSPEQVKSAIGNKGTFDRRNASILQAPRRLGPALVRDMTRDDIMDHKKAYFSGYSAPRHVAINEALGNQLINFANSRITAPIVAKSMATDVLGSHYNDKPFVHILGAAIVEDQLRAVKKGFEDAAAAATDPVVEAEMRDKAMSVNTLVGQPYSPFKTEAQYQAVLKNKDIVDALERHKNTIQPMAEAAHVELGGKLAQGGEQTGAFANLMAILAPDDIEGTRKMVYGSRQGDMTNQLRRGSAFSKQRAGTAAMYETDYRVMAERMIRGNWEQKALRDLIKGYTDEGVAYEQKAGQPPPTTVSGKRLVPETIELRGAGPGQTRHIKLHIREDLHPEFKQAVSTDSKIHKAAVGYALDLISDLQMQGATDATWHTVNMLASIATSQGGFKHLSLDVSRRLPLVNIVDAVARVVKGTVDGIIESPETQRELAQIARVGAARSPAVHSSLIGKLAEKVIGTPKVDPSYWTGRAINAIDKGGRLVRNRMFDTLVERGWARDTDLNRREFINQMGQYNRRLMSQFQNIMRDYSVAPFVVAGRNFNRLAFHKLMLSPGFQAVSPRVAAKARIVEAVSTFAALSMFPIAANMALTGTIWGRKGKGVPFGTVDTGKDGEDGRAIVWDPLQTMLLRRGMRLTGAPEIDRGVRQGLPPKEVGQNMVRTAVNAWLHPWMGPVPKFAKTLANGRDTSGHLLSRNPDDYQENAKAALSQLNPTWAAMTKTTSEGEPGGVTGVAKQLGGAIGVKSGYYPSGKEKYDAAVETLGHKPSFGERAMISRKLANEREPNTEVTSKRNASERVLWRDFARQDRMLESLPDDQQKWLAKNKLTFQGFEAEVAAGHGIKVPMNADEAARMEKVFGVWYQKAIGQVMKYPGFADMDQHRKQVVLDKYLDRYRETARKVWKSIVISGRSTVDVP